MNKLVGFLWGDKQKGRKAGSTNSSPVTTPTRTVPPRFTAEEKEEIYSTLRRAKDSRATVVLLEKMQEDSMLQNEFVGVEHVVDSTDDSVDEDTDSTIDSTGDDNFGTMRVYPAQGEAEEEACDFSTMRIKDDDEGAMDFSTTRIHEDSDDPCGTFNFTPTRGTPKKDKEDKRVGLKNRPTKKKSNKASLREKKKKAKKQKKGVNTFGSSSSLEAKEDEEVPAFLAAYRQPEEWELNILALEKGEAREGMFDNNAFKRWNTKARPSVPSMLLKLDSSDPLPVEGAEGEAADDTATATQ